MGTSFLYVFIIQRTKDLYIKNTLQVCIKNFRFSRFGRDDIIEKNFSAANSAKIRG